MNSCYILYSPLLDIYYVGITHDDLQARIAKHNSAFYGKKHFTSRTRDWELYVQIKCDSYSQARKIELHIKRMKSRTFLQNLREYPEMAQRLLDKYKFNGKH